MTSNFLFSPRIGWRFHDSITIIVHCELRPVLYVKPIFCRYSSRYFPDFRPSVHRYRQISADIPFIDRNNPQVADIYLPIFSGFSHSSWTSCRFFSLISKQKPWLIPVLYHGNQNKYLTLELSSFIFVQIMFIIAVVWSASLCSCVGLRSLAHFKYGVFFSSCCILREIWAS